MTWKRDHPSDSKSDYRIIDKREVLDKNLWPCGDCGDRSGRSISWSGNLQRKDIRIYRGGRIFHYITRPLFFYPESYQIRQGSIRVRCGRYIALPNDERIKQARTLI